MSSRRRFLRACTVAAFAGLAGCTAENASDTTTAATGSATPAETPTTSDATPTTTTESTAPGETAWEQSVSGAVENAPVLSDDALYVGTAGGTVTALAPDDGRPRWEFQAEEPIQGRPTVAGDLVLAVSGRTGLSEHHTVYALDAETGTEAWSFSPTDWWLEILGATDGTVFVATEDDNLEASGQNLYALSLSDGSQQWSVEVGDNSGGLVTDSTVFVPSYGVVDAVGTDGTRRWSYETEDYQFRTLAVAGDTVAFTTAPSGPTDATINGLDVTTGEQRWTVEDWNAYTTRADGDRLFVGGSQVARIDPATGEAQWVADQQAALYDAPIAEGTLYTAGDTAAAIDIADGSVAWSTSIDAHLTQPAGVGGGSLLTLVSPSRDERNRTVRAFDTTSGDQQWEFTADAELTDPVVGTSSAYVGERSTVRALAL